MYLENPARTNLRLQLQLTRQIHQLPHRYHYHQELDHQPLRTIKMKLIKISKNLKTKHFKTIICLVKRELLQNHLLFDLKIGIILRNRGR